MRVTYATVIVRDMEEPVRFYEQVMGFEIAGRHEPAPGVVITLMRLEGEALGRSKRGQGSARPAHVPLNDLGRSR